jgi:uncharacterized membrane protein
MMRRIMILLLAGLLWGVTAVTGVTAVVPAYAQTEQPTVQAVMFWMEGCGHCDWVKQYTLAPLQEQYGAQLEIHLVELRTSADFDKLFDLAAAQGVPRSHVGVPFLLIGDEILIGSGQIPAELPGLIEQHLAAGGVDYPPYPALAEWLPQAEACLAGEPCPGTSRFLPPDYTETEAQESNVLTGTLMSEGEPVAVADSPAAAAHDGFRLAIATLVGMVLALGYTAVHLMRARQGKDPIFSLPAGGVWQNYVLPALIFLGLSVAAYLAYVETQAVTAVCGPIGNCNAVQTSEYAYLFGIPIGVLGVIGYLAILATWLWGQWQNDRRAPLILLAMTGFGVLFSIYLTYLEPFVIGAVCAWCLSSAVIMTLLMLLVLSPAANEMQLAAVRNGRKKRWRK